MRDCGHKQTMYAHSNGSALQLAHLLLEMVNMGSAIFKWVTTCGHTAGQGLCFCCKSLRGGQNLSGCLCKLRTQEITGDSHVGIWVLNH